MANTYSKLYAHAVFAVKYRAALIDPLWEPDLHRVMANLFSQVKSKAMIINGIEDHVHCLFSYKPSVCLSDVIGSVKAKSSKWINDNALCGYKFHWQNGFGVFSCNPADLDGIYKYIARQKEHHSAKPFLREYKAMLKKYNVDYEENYIFKELE
jgi:REP element-mobilizing transposase RayT